MGMVREGRFDAGKVHLYYRQTGKGTPLVVLHGGPDFNHSYLLPEIDVVADGLRLILYDQRGRGLSAPGCNPEDVSLPSEMEDLDVIRAGLGRERIALLGHSWGGLLAAEYTAHHPGRVSHLILMNTAPLSHESFHEFLTAVQVSREPGDLDEMCRLAATPEFQRGDVDVEGRFYRLHFKPTIPDPSLLDDMVGRLRLHFTAETVLLARAIEARLNAQTWESPEYDALAALASVAVPTLLIHGERDFIPVAIASEIAKSLQMARLEVLDGCGHFSFAERPGQVAGLVTEFLAGSEP